MSSEQRRLSSMIRELIAGRRLLFAAIVGLSLAASLSEGFAAGLVLVLFDEGRAATTAVADLPGISTVLSRAGELPLAERIRFGGLVLLAVLVLRGVLYYLSGVLSLWLEESVVRDLRQRIYDKLLGRDIESLASERTGHLLTALNRYTAETGVVVRLISKNIVCFTTILIYLTLLLLDSWQLTLAAAILIGTSAVLTRNSFRQRQVRAGQRVNEAEAEVNSFGIESLTALPLIRLFGQEERFRARYRDLVVEREQRARRRSAIGELNRPVFVVVNAVVLCGLILIGTRLFSAQLETWVAYLPLFLLIALRLLGLAMVLAEMRGRVNARSASVHAIHALLAEPAAPSRDSPGTRAHTGLQRGVSFEDVTFSYQGADEPTLHGLSFHMARGTTTGLVGPSGAGKTTVANLLTGLLQPGEGRLLVDDADLGTIDPAQWRGRLAVVAQETVLFHDTVEENIRFGLESATRSQIREAARIANADEFIDRLPDGLDTVVGERGARLSAGQRQRLAIARAVLRDPEILILDEATSNLDSESQRKVEEALARAGASRTVLIVAHRLSAVRRADNIVVLDHGRLAEQGTHDALWGQRGLYWQLAQNPEIG